MHCKAHVYKVTNVYSEGHVEAANEASCTHSNDCPSSSATQEANEFIVAPSLHLQAKHRVHHEQELKLQACEKTTDVVFVVFVIYYPDPEACPCTCTRLSQVRIQNCPRNVSFRDASNMCTVYKSMRIRS